LDFVKMQGIGNDFILIDCIQAGLYPDDLRRHAVRLCKRRFGIGSDGILLVCPSAAADLRMYMFNPDGSEGMCGNGLRCFAKYAYESGLVKKERFAVETIGGIVDVELDVSPDPDEAPVRGHVKSVRANMGKPRLRRGQIPMLGLADEQVVNEVLSVGEARFHITCVSMGNPHCVIFVPEVDAVPLEEWGPQLENHPAFPERTNVEFVEVLSDESLKVRVWERGAGVTLACGTGACASVVAGSMGGQCGRKAAVILPGGGLEIEWVDSGHVLMAGPAETVFRGTVEL
jgi:diaminopimelate epimerase